MSATRPSPLLDAAVRAKGARHAPAQPSAASAVYLGPGTSPSYVRVRLYGGELELRAAPGNWPVGGLVWVALGPDGRPERVTGPVAPPAAGQAVETHMPELIPSTGSSGPAPWTPEDEARVAELERVAADGRAAQAELDAALDNLATVFGEDEAERARIAAELEAQGVTQADLARTIAAQGQTVQEQAQYLAATRAQLPILSTSVPSGVAPQGTLWYQRTTSGQIAGMWEQTAAGVASTWTSRPLGDAAIGSMSVGKLIAGTATISEAVADKLWAQVITAQKVQANSGVFGGLYARHLAVTSTNGASGRGFALTDAGFVFTAEDGSPAIEMTTASDTVISVLAGGERVAGVERDGDWTGHGVSVAEDVQFDSGRSLIGELAGLSSAGYPKVLLGREVPVPAGETRALIETSFRVPPGGHRQIRLTGAVSARANTQGASMTLHVSTGASASTTTQAAFAREIDAAARTSTREWSWPLSTSELRIAAPGDTVRVLMAVTARGEAITIRDTDWTWMMPEDMGPERRTVRTMMEVNAPPDRAVERSRVTTPMYIFPANWQTYENGNAYPKGGSRIGGRNIAQGINSGTQWSSVVEFGADKIAAALQGARLIKAEVTLVNKHWWNGAGGTAVVGVYGSIPASLPASQIGAWNLLQLTWNGRGGSRKGTLPESTHAGLISGSTRSITLFTNSGDPNAYGYFDPTPTRLILHVEK